MSTFSSVIHKSSKKFAPKAVPRRNAQRLNSQTPTSSAQNRPPPTADSETGLSSVDALPVDVSTAPSSDAVSVSTHSATNTRSTSLDVDQTSTKHAPESLSRNPRTQIRGELNAPVQHERSSILAGIRESGHRTANNQADQIPLVRSSVPQGVKRGQQEKEPTDVARLVASPFSSATTKSGPSPARKKRKTTPQLEPTSDLAPLRVSLSSEPAARPSASQPATRPRPRNWQTQETEDLLQNATTQAATVSALADAINGTTSFAKKSSRKRRQPRTGMTALTAINNENEGQQTGRSKITPTRESTIQSAAAEIVAEAIAGSPRRRRKQTPEGAEDHQIEPSVVKMGELVKDERLGKKGWREAKMQQVDWDEVKKQRKEALLEAQRRRNAREKEKDIAAREPVESATAAVPTMELVDGQIVIVDASREVDRQAEAEGLARDMDQTVRVDNDVTNRVNQVTVGRQRGVGPGTKWDDEMEQRFYRGLRMFGTDFMMISSMFPGLTRRHIKLKYVKEERQNFDRIKRNLENREPVDLGEFQEMTDKVLQDPKKVQEEIDAEEKRIREEDEQRRAREDGEPHPEDGTVLESIEQPGAELDGPASDAEDSELPGRASTTDNRFASAVRVIVQDASAPRKKRKQSGSVKKKDALKRGKRPMEGVEERLGPIDEVTR